MFTGEQIAVIESEVQKAIAETGEVAPQKLVDAVRSEFTRQGMQYESFSAVQLMRYLPPEMPKQAFELGQPGM